jgi:ABC-type nickel/cobalt efflux system permease component RcnA
LKILKIGIASVLAMSLGMSIPIIFSAYLAWFGKTGIFKILKQNEKQASITAFILSCFGYVLLIGFSLYIALPFFLNLHF